VRPSGSARPARTRPPASSSSCADTSARSVLPTWDATLLTNCRRARILPEEYRPLVFSIKVPHSVGTILVDGAVAGTWRVEASGGKAVLRYTVFERIPTAAERDLREEAAALVGFVEPEASSHAVVRRPAE
jgi:hypothetical protein